MEIASDRPRARTCPQGLPDAARTRRDRGGRRAVDRHGRVRVADRALGLRQVDDPVDDRGAHADTSGVIRVSGTAIAGPGPDRGVVFQAPCLFPWLSALANVMIGLDEVYQSEQRSQRAERATRALDVVGLGDAYHVRPAAMSAGMRQRVALARAFALAPRTLLLDEPFGMLDSITRSELQDLLLEMREVCPTTLLVTHDIDEALLLSDRIAVMTNGPAARLRSVIEIPFSRPRIRADIVGSSEWHRLREQILNLLEH